MTDAAVIANTGFIDDADTTYLNGVAIGSTGAFPPSFDSAWDEPREYCPPDGLLVWGGRNVIAVRMYDGTGGGGFYKGPIGLFSKATLRALNGLNSSPAAGDAALTVSDPGHLVNGTFSLPEALRVEIAPACWAGPVSNATSAITFRQHIGASDALRTGSYARTLTFTLSTTMP
jgi:hypothetical protein